MKNRFYFFLPLFLLGLAPGHGWAQRSSVADVNPHEYAPDTAEISIRTAAKRLQKGGAVLVRLHTNKRQLETLEKQGRQTEAARLHTRQQAINDSLRAAFRRHFRMAPVYFFPSDQATEVLAGNFSSLEPARPEAAESLPTLQQCVILDYDDHDNLLTVSSWKNNRIWRPYGLRRGSAPARGMGESVIRFEKRMLQFAGQTAR